MRGKINNLLIQAPGPQVRHSGCKKPDPKGHPPYDSIYMIFCKSTTLGTDAVVAGAEMGWGGGLGGVVILCILTVWWLPNRIHLPKLGEPYTMKGEYSCMELYLNKNMKEKSQIVS